jgi:hypothetical protein
VDRVDVNRRIPRLKQTSGASRFTHATNVGSDVSTDDTEPHPVAVNSPEFLKHEPRCNDTRLLRKQFRPEAIQSRSLVFGGKATAKDTRSRVAAEGGSGRHAAGEAWWLRRVNTR